MKTISYPRSLQRLVDERFISDLVDAADLFFSANDYLPDDQGGYVTEDDCLEASVNAFEAGAQLAHKAARKGQQIFAAVVNEAGGESTLYFIADSANSIINKIKKLPVK